jgi:hypothetical protein
MGAISTLLLKSNRLCTKEAGKALSQMLAANSTLKELDLSDNQSPAGDTSARDGPGFSQELAVGIKDNGALSVANVMGNRIGKEQLAKLQEIMHSKPNLVSLCGIADDATEADLSGLGMDADDAAILASELPDKGAISTVIVNTFPLPIQDIKSKSELDFSGKGLKVEDAIIIAALIPSNVSRTMLCRPYFH